MNVTLVEAKLMVIRFGLSFALDSHDNCNITVITNSLVTARKIIESHVNSLQAVVVPLALKIKTFLSKDNHNTIQFWHCPNKAKWPRHQLIDKQAKESHDLPTFPSKSSYFFSRKKECDDILCEWQTLFLTNPNKVQLFMKLEDTKLKTIKHIHSRGVVVTLYWLL